MALIRIKFSISGEVPLLKGLLSGHTRDEIHEAFIDSSRVDAVNMAEQQITGDLIGIGVTFFKKGEARRGLTIHELSFTSEPVTVVGSQ